MNACALNFGAMPWASSYPPLLLRPNATRESVPHRAIQPCPDHTEKRTLWHLMQVVENAGITLTETLAMQPAASVCGLYFAHPEAAYFDVGPRG